MRERERRRERRKEGEKKKRRLSFSYLAGCHRAAADRQEWTPARNKIQEQCAHRVGGQQQATGQGDR